MVERCIGAWEEGGKARMHPQHSTSFPPEAMNPHFKHPHQNVVPELVHVVLSQATKRRDCGELPQALFEAQLARIESKELAPRGLSLLVRELGDGTTRFLIKEQRTWTVCDMIECAPSHRSQQVAA